MHLSHAVLQIMNTTQDPSAIQHDAQPGEENLMPERRRWGFPQEAWPALAEFAPDKFVSLQLRFDQAASGSKERRNIQVEIEKLIAQFTEFAVASVAEQRKNDLVRIGDLVKSKHYLEKRFLATPLDELLKEDLTPTEVKRLGRLIDQQIGPSRGRVSDALKALQN